MKKTTGNLKTKQEKAGKVVSSHIIWGVNLTVEKELKENPELLFEAENYPEGNSTLEPEDEKPEIYEYWAISDWIANRLKERGEIVFEMLDFTVWGRQCTGQAIKMDKVIKEIADELSF